MINHSDCDHPSTPSARAKCRRARAGGSTPKRSGSGATPREPAEKDSYGQVPRDRDMECDVCGVERIQYKGTDLLTGMILHVGEKCFWYVKRSPDLTPLRW